MTIKVVKQYSQVVLKDGRRGCVIEAFYGKTPPVQYDIDIDKGPVKWETIYGVSQDSIESASEWEEVEV